MNNLDEYILNKYSHVDLQHATADEMLAALSDLKVEFIEEYASFLKYYSKSVSGGKDEAVKDWLEAAAMKIYLRDMLDDISENEGEYFDDHGLLPSDFVITGE